MKEKWKHQGANDAITREFAENALLMQRSRANRSESKALGLKWAKLLEVKAWTEVSVSLEANWMTLSRERMSKPVLFWQSQSVYLFIVWNFMNKPYIVRLFHALVSNGWCQTTFAIDTDTSSVRHTHVCLYANNMPENDCIARHSL